MIFPVDMTVRFFRFDCRACGAVGELFAHYSDSHDGALFRSAFWGIREPDGWAITLAKTAERPDLGLPERPPEVEEVACACGCDDVLVRLYEQSGTLGSGPQWLSPEEEGV